MTQEAGEPATTAAGEQGGTTGGGTATTTAETVETVETLAGDGGVVCDEAGGCVAYLYRAPDGGLFLCGELRVVSVRLAVVAPPTETQPGETAPSEPAETQEERTELRPACAPGAERVPAVGVDVGALGGVRTSDDGESEWTQGKVRLSGRIVDGTFVADG